MASTIIVPTAPAEAAARGTAPSAPAPSRAGPGRHKTLIICCDGTWVNATGKDSKDAPPTNVSRLIRSLRQTTPQGRPQVVLYHAGVGSSGQLLDASIGGTFGLGLDQDIRDLYQFVCLNYADGDAIVLVGFSRGAFTARSVADLVASVGLLTGDGQDRFYDIFEDYENMADKKRDDKDFLCPAGTLEAYVGQTGEQWIGWENRRKTQYRAWLKSQGYTRDTFVTASVAGCGVPTEAEITIKAVAVWDTVGCLGIPAVPLIGLKGSAKQWKFTNTQISRKVENAFQALGLDEPRYDFLPSLWELLPDNTTTNLRQVWFPGSHTNIGGGQNDQQMANLTLAWICDQLASVGVAFDEARMTAIFSDGLRYGAVHPFPHVPAHGAAAAAAAAVSKLLPSAAKRHNLLPHPMPWAGPGLFGTTALGSGAAPLVRDTADCPGKWAHPHPDAPTAADLWARGARFWALGQTRMPTSLIQRAAGTIVRRPAQFVRVDPTTSEARPDEPLLNTNERIHASVRVRLACSGLSVDDRAVWTCEGLTGEKPADEDDDEDQLTPLWRLERVDGVARVEGAGGEEEEEKAWGADAGYYPLSKVAGAGHWQWVFAREDSIGAKKPREDRYSNNQMPTKGPLLRVLPEELPTGRWQRLLLGLTVGSPDVLAWAAANPYPSQRK